MIKVFERIFRKEDLKLQEEKFAIAKDLERDFINRFFINERLRSTYIKIDEQTSRNVLTLIEEKKLMGWDYMTTSLLSTLLDESRVVRANIELWKKEPYPHAWIEINIDEVSYCFDPCFNILMLKSDYKKLFKPDNIVKIDSNIIKEKLLDYFKNNYSNKTYIFGTDQITDPFYKANCLVDRKIENNKIKGLDIKYYYK